MTVHRRKPCSAAGIGGLAPDRREVARAAAQAYFAAGRPRVDAGLIARYLWCEGLDAEDVAAVSRGGDGRRVA